MEHQRFRTLLLFLSLCLAPNAFADEPADSLAFETKRRQILGHSPDERATLVLGAAEELARDGYYTEALDLIFSMEEEAPTSLDWDPDTSFLEPDSLALDQAPLADTLAASPVTAARPSPPASKSTGSGYVQSALGYDAWEGLDTSVSAKIRTKLQWDPAGRAVERITTVFQGSDRNAYFDVAAKGASFRRMLKFEGGAQAEKKLWQAYGDSLDRLYLQAKVEGNSRALGKPLSLVAPVFAEAQEYRFGNRPGSLSYRAYGAMPGLEAISSDLRKSLFLSWELRRMEFPSAPLTDNFRNGPVASAEWYGNRVTLDAETRLQTTRYERDFSLYRLRQLETRAGAFVRTWPWLRAGIRTVGGTETEDYRDTVEFADFNRILADYQLQGSTWMVQPQLIAEWASIYSVSLSLAFTRARYPILSGLGGSTLQSSRYIEESYDDWKPEAGVTILTKAIFFTLAANYQENRVPYAPLDYTLESSKGFGLNCNLFWKVRPWLEIDFTGMGSHRIEGAKKDRIQDLISMSLGLTSRFQ